MIIARSPLRLPLGGGGTDLPSYYSRFGGFLIAGAIDKHVYITLQRTFTRELLLKYSALERAASVDDVQHPIIRECLRSVGVSETDLEITSTADLPAGTGLGSSSSFATALLAALHRMRHDHISRAELAEEACGVEIERLGAPIGKQDQYAAAFGGINCYEFQQDGRVVVEPLRLAPQTTRDLEEGLALFFTGLSRSASDILRDQDTRSRRDDPAILDNLHTTKEIGLRSRGALLRGDVREFAHLMDMHWRAKRNRSRGMSNRQIDAWYELGVENGALGGKLVGAGGGGFLLFYAEDKRRLRRAMSDAGLPEVAFRFDFSGTEVMRS